MKRNYTFISLVIILFAAVVSIANSSGRNDARAGAPGDLADCSQCHTSSGGTGNIELVDPPGTIVAGTTYPLTLTLSDDNASTQIGGFQIVATDGTNNSQVGTFNPVDGQATRVNQVDRLVQSSPKDFANGQVSWDIEWTAPESLSSEEIVFYFVGNAANDNNSNGAGDFTRSGSLTVPFSLEPSGLFGPNVERIPLKAFPNPLRVGQELTVTLDATYLNTATAIRLLDLSGRVILENRIQTFNQDRVVLPTQEIAPGLYLVQIQGSDNRVAAAQVLVMQ